MPTTMRRRLRSARRGAWYVVALTLVAVALLVGLAGQLLPLVERNPERVAAWLSARAGRTVSFQHLDTEWTRRGPLLRVDGLRIGDGPDAVPIGAAEILVSQYAGLLPGRSFTELRLRGLELTLERGADGRWKVQGLPGQQRGGDPLSTLDGLGELQVVDGRLTVLAPAIGLATTLPRVDLRMRVDGARVRVASRAWMRDGVSPVRGVLDFDRGRGDGRAWVALERADLAAWSALRLGGISPRAGAGEAAAWAVLRGHRVTEVTTRVRLQGLRVAGAEVDGTRPEHDFGAVDARARWRTIDGGWRFDAARLRLGRDREAQVLDGLVVAGGERIALLADRIDAGAMLALAALSDRAPDGLRRWVRRARPDAVLHGLEVSGRRGGALTARARVEDLRIEASGPAPGIAGLAGQLAGDRQGFSLVFDPAARVVFDWPDAFGAPHRVSARGAIAGWRDGGGWQVATRSLRVDGEGYGADARGGLRFDGDGGRPDLQLLLSVDPTALPVARRFWVRNHMSPKAVAWLDAALVDGTVEGGRALLAGDLDDWPFRPSGAGAARGVFKAEATVADATVRFQPGWPAATDVDARVDFTADGFALAGSAELAGIRIPEVSAAIDRFGGGTLAVRARTDTEASRLLALLRASPLRAAHGDTLRSLRASGPVGATFALDMPLVSARGPATLGGEIDLRDARLADGRWDLAFDDVRGTARYDGAGFSAESLHVVRGGQRGRLALRAGPGHVREPANALEGDLGIALAAPDLLARAPQLAWLGPYIQGRSPWSIAVAVPRAGNGAGRLLLRSNLVGTRLSLPAPLRKPTAEPLAARIETRLPLDQGEVSVSLGDRVALRARSVGEHTGVRVVLGSDQVAEAPPRHGLVASGTAATLDAIDWAALARPGDAGAGAGLPLLGIDILAMRLQLLGGDFARTRIRASPAAAGTRLRFDGGALAGSLLLPRARDATLSGRLQRLHWRTAGRTPGAGPRATERIGDEVDPAAIPPLDMRVDDLRFGGVALGTATLLTRPAAGGMRIERLETRAPTQRIDLAGSWTGRGAAARTRIDVGVDSDDFGALVAGLGAGGRLEGGQGEARFDATWPGSPATFRLDALEGALLLTVKSGRLVQVEPGAGRVLGLLSIAELPRRLTLDFGDFFEKGFAFNRIGGTVRFAGGQARSDDLVIDGPAAEIRIRGSANLRAQTYDQTIEVLPKTGNLLAAVGAITAGPVGAAVGAVANAVLRKPLGEMGARTYRVTGPWKDPQVDVGNRGPGPPG